MLTPELLSVNAWDTVEEVAALQELAPGRRVLEVGSYQGFTAIVFAQAGAVHVDAVDWHRGDGQIGQQDTLCTMWTNLDRFHVRDHVTLHVGRSEWVLKALRPRFFDLAFVDGDHDQAALDTRLCLYLVSPGGLIVWHDRERWQVPAAISWAEEATGQRSRVLAGSLAALDVP